MKHFIVLVILLLCFVTSSISQIRDPQDTVSILVPKASARAALNGECFNRKLFLRFTGTIPETHILINVRSANEADLTTQFIWALGIIDSVRALEPNEAIPFGFHDAGSAGPNSRLIGKDRELIRFCK